MKWLLLSVISLLALLAGYLLFSAAPTLPQQTQPVAAIDAAASEPASPHSAAVPKPAHLEVSETIPQPISESFQLLAKAYASELEMPAYSRPLTADDTHLLKPNAYVPQPVSLEGGASASVVLSQYRYSYPQAIDVKLEVNGLTVSGATVQLKAESTMSDQVLANDAMLHTDQGWVAQLNAEPEWDGPLQVSVTFRANGKQQTLNTGILYSNPVATITGVEASRSSGSDMLIPVQLEVKQAGFYRLRANLYTEDNQPLALLIATEKLSAGSAEILLRAYKSVLRNESGPYLLGTFVLERRAAIPGEQTRYGDSDKPMYELEYFALDQLTDEPWQPDAQELQRLQFLQQLAGDNDR